MRCERDGQNNREMSVRSPQRQTTQFVGEIRELSVDIWTVSQIKKKKKEEVYKGKITLIWSSLRIQRSAKKCTSSFSSIKALKKIDPVLYAKNKF